MQRFKKPFLWLTLLSLVISLLPVGLAAPKASAADALPIYFIPSTPGLRDTFSLTMDYTGDAEKKQLSRENAYKVTTGTLTIEGSFRAGLSSNNMLVTVERLNSVASSVANQIDWVPDTNNVYSNTMTTSGNNFSARDVTLFSGFNRITFSGTQGGVTQSESFYVLYDKIPYLEELKMYEGGSLAKHLNEGTPVVTREAMVSLEGIVQNTNTVTVSVNGKSPNTVPRDEYSGKFYASGLSLAEGVNDLQIVITNGSDTITMNRTIFRISDTQKMTGLYVASGTTAYDAYGKTPVITEGAGTGVSIIGQVIIPYQKDSDTPNEGAFSANGKVAYKGASDLDFVDVTASLKVLKMKAVNADGTYLNETGQDVIIPNASGSPEYLAVTFMVDGIPAVDSATNTISLRVTYGDPAAIVPRFSATVPVTFRYLPGQATIKNMYYLPAYETESQKANFDATKDLTKVNLNGATVNSGTFYVYIEGSAALTGNVNATYLPKGSKTLNIDTPAVASGSNWQIYKISNFSSGQQQLAFWYTSGEEARATVSYITMTKISFTNLIYGQTIEVDSKDPSTLELKVEGSYLGFENFKASTNASYSVNGLASAPGETTKVGEVSYPTDNSFVLKVKIGAQGPLFYGENRIIFYGTSMDGNGNARTVTGEMLVYIVDKNGATISNLQPAAVSGTTAALPTQTQMQDALENVNTGAQEALDAVMNNLFLLSPSFTYSAEAGNYTTNNKTAHLLGRGSGATRVKLYFGSTALLDETLGTAVTEKTSSFTYDFGGGSKSYSYTLVGSEKDFVFRVHDVDLEVPGSYVFNLELINDSGSRTNKKIELVRVVEPYRLLAPQPNVDGQYIVNKNFVRFDIEAEGATKVLIDGEEAALRQEAGLADRYIYDYTGLKADKSTKVSIEIVRADTSFKDDIQIYYTSAVNVDSQFMAVKVATKYSVFNKKIELNFPKGTILQTAFPGTSAIEYYPDNKLLFGIADPENGVVGKRDDYGNYIGGQNNNIESGYDPIQIPIDVRAKFSSPESRGNFTPISDVYWIHGGLGESGDIGATNGLAPYSLDGYFTRFPASRKIVPSQRGELTLSYNSSVVDEAGTTITVFRLTDTGIWENIGGEVDTKGHKITVPFDDFGYYMVMKLKRGYSDITNHGWARNILNGLYSKGIMKNLRGDSFGTDDRITRGEFATLLVKGLNIPLNYPTDGNHSKSTFTDVGPGAATETWSYKYIETAARAGIVAGTNEGEFAPYTPITREQAAVMISRALKLKLSLNDDKLNSALAKSFTDSGSMDYYARPAIQAVSKAKIMNGAANVLPGQKKPTYSFNPKGYMTRAEAGKIAVELFKKSTDIFPKTFN